MNRDLHDITEPIISSGEGWQQMQNLLNEHLPVKRKLFNKNRMRPYAITALLTCTLLCTFLKLDTTIFTASSNTKNLLTKTISQTSRGSNFSFSNTNKKTNSTASFSGSLTSYKKNNTDPFTWEEDFILPRYKVENIATIEELIKSSKAVTVAGIIEQQTTKTVVATATDKNTTSAIENHLKKKNGIKKSWNLLGGIGINTSLNNNQNLQPYPVAELRYNVSPAIFIAGGIAAFSTVATNTSGINKTVYINDIVNNIHLYNEVYTYKRLSYADIPLSVGINISKNISIQNGIQLSVLLNNKKQVEHQQYDYQMNLTNMPPDNPTLTTTANAQKEYNIDVRNMDYRFITGIRYTQNKIAVGLKYQHGFKPVGTGNYIHSNKNAIVSINVLYQIK